MTEPASALDRTPPRNLDAERAVIGSVLLDNELLAEMLPVLDVGDFYRAGHGYIYEAMSALYGRQHPVDYLTLVDELKRTGHEQDSGGMDYIQEIVEAVPVAANGLYYADLVKRASTLRKLIAATVEINTAVYEHEGDLSPLLAQVEQQVFAITMETVKADPVDVRTCLSELFKEMDSAATSPGGTGVMSGFPDLDALTGGFQDGEVIMLGARPSMGKSALCTTMAANMSAQGHRVMLCSLEVRRVQVVTNMICQQTGVSSLALRAGRLSESDNAAVFEAATALANQPLVIVDAPSLRPRDIRAALTRAVSAGEPYQIVIIDYLQLMPTDSKRGVNREQEVARLSREIKHIARDFDIPVVIAAQLNRQVESRTEHRPRMSDLRESGSLEQDADVVLLLHREFYYSHKDEDRGKAELILSKQRNGPVGVVHLTFTPSSVSFTSVRSADAETAVSSGYDPVEVEPERTEPRERENEYVPPGDTPFDFDDDQLPPMP